MAKRRADKQMRPEDVDFDDECEDAGTYESASAEDLAKRVIKKAKRRNTGGSETSSPLVNFSGFSTAPTGSPFSFFNKISQNVEETPPKPLQPADNSLSVKSKDLEALKSLNLSCAKWIQQHLDKNPYVVLVPVFKDYEKHLASLNLTSNNSVGASTVSTTSISTLASTTFGSSTLNQASTGTSAPTTVSFSLGSPAAPALKSFPSFTPAKTTEADSKPCQSLASSTLFKFGSSPLNNGTTTSADSVQSPVFSIGSSTGECAVQTSKGISNVTMTSISTFASTTFGSSTLNQASTETSAPTTAVFSLGSPSAPALKSFPSFAPPKTTDADSKPSPSLSSSTLFKFGSTTSSPLNSGTTTSAVSVQSPVFGIGSPSGSTSTFSFGLANKPTEAAPSVTESDAAKPGSSDEPTDETPNFDFVPVGEEGSVYNVRCKVFFKKDNTFASAGVGTLYLKPVAGGKTQLITRADTAQGSVLLNLILSPDLPLQASAKNNVLLVCVPTPDAKPPPVPVLIRVKNGEERDKLLKEMERLRGS